MDSWFSKVRSQGSWKLSVPFSVLQKPHPTIPLSLAPPLPLSLKPPFMEINKAGQSQQGKLRSMHSLSSLVFIRKQN